MIEPLLDLINIDQLEMLGFKKEYFNYIVIFLVIFVICTFMKPIISFLSDKNYTFVLTYLISSLTLITIALILARVQAHISVLKFVFQPVIMFGFCLAIYMIYQFIKTRSG